MREMMKREKIQAWLIMMPLLLLMACSEVIDLGTETTGGQIVVYGRITNGTQGNVINISRTGFLGQAATPIVGASITIQDGQGTTASYVDAGAGEYRLESNGLTGTPGESYSVWVELPSGEIFESIPETMPEVSAKDSLHYIIQEIEETSELGVTFTRSVVSIFADTEIFNPRPDLFIKWDVDEVYSFEQAALPTHNFPFYIREICYIANELEQQSALLYDGSSLRLNNIKAQAITDRTIDESFRGTHFFNLIQQNLTKGAHTFWQGLDQNVNRVGSIFDQPPGELPTNLYSVNDPAQEVLGYFEVVSVDTARLRITNREVDRFFPNPCPHNPEVEFAPFMNFRFISRYYEPECLDCTLLRNSNTERPHYFD